MRAWAQQVVQEAATEMELKARAQCPVAAVGGGEMLQSIQTAAVGDLTWEITAEDRGFTDEGPEAHEIVGNPLLAFDWPAPGPGLFPAIFRHVNWVPGDGVAANKGWWTERTITDANWLEALTTAGDIVRLGE